MNRLAGALSPYLRQHANNPVHWREWDAAALTEAKQKDRPILLSVGYAACHWCHVMAHESFENEEIAALMNGGFVNIKVDREERPDIDRVYQLAHYLIARRSGGWPLTMFLSPDGEPFFGGTYFPPAARGGMPAFPDILRRVTEAWENHRDKIQEQNKAILAMLARVDAPPSSDSPALDGAVLQAAAAQMKSAFDKTNGGLGDAPKFPHPVELSFALEQGALSGDNELCEIALESLAKMARRGLFDHIGGGFFRYCVDGEWEIPHFEKMLYDNALLLRLCADAYHFSQTGGGDARAAIFANAAAQTAGFILRELKNDGGAFCSSLDADSEGEEGKFYAWTKEEIEKYILSPEEYAAARRVFNLDKLPNFEGKYHLHKIVDDFSPQTKEICEKLFHARKQRIRPGLDDKVLTAWNALAISALARAGRVFNKPEWRDAANAAMSFIRKEMWEEKSKKLYAVWRANERRHIAYLDDHAFLLEAAIELLRDEVAPELCAFAAALADAMLSQFEDAPDKRPDEKPDKKNADARPCGGFYFTAADAEKLIRRAKPADDNATPSGNGVAARALQRFGWLVGEPRYLEAARQTLAFFNGTMRQSPLATTTLIAALGEHLRPPPLALIAPADAAVNLGEWRALANRPYPQLAFFLSPTNRAALPPALADKTPPANGVCAYICQAQTCRPPISDLDEFADALAGEAAV